MDYVKLSKQTSYALRHAPWIYELELDDEGWTPLEDLLEGLGSEAKFSGVSRADLERIIASSEKSRFEIAGEHIRALYGHSIPGKLLKKKATPPEFLYHGTVTRAVEAIRQDGLKPMRRQYVHFSVDTTMATIVGTRRGNDLVILKIPAREASAQGIVFYEGNAQVWLADNVPPQWIIFP